jgi:hypothetical protein
VINLVPILNKKSSFNSQMQLRLWRISCLKSAMGLPKMAHRKTMKTVPTGGAFCPMSSPQHLQTSALGTTSGKSVHFTNKTLL